MRNTGFLLAILCLLMAGTSINAQDDCNDFNNGVDNWMITTMGPVWNPFRPGGQSDRVMAASENEANDWLFNAVDYQGDISDQCICWDYNLFIDSFDPDLDSRPTIRIFQGNSPTNFIRAAEWQADFVTNENEDWVQVCTQVNACQGNSIPNGWTMLDNGDCTGWNTLITNATGIGFHLDLPPEAPEPIYLFDNLCLESCPAEPTECALVLEEEIDCRIDGTVEISFSLQYFGTETADNFEIVDGAGNVLYNVGGLSLNAGDVFGPVQLVVDAPANGEYCIGVRFFAESLCCHIEYCFDTSACPDCFTLTNVSTECTDDGFTYCGTLTNFSGRDITQFRVVPVDPAMGICAFGDELPFTINIPNAPIPDGESFDFCLDLSDCGAGWSPGDELSVKIILLDYIDPDWCCHSEPFKITVPDCDTPVCDCESFEEDVLQGFSYEFFCPDLHITPSALGECDEVFWSLNGAFVGTSQGDGTYVMRLNRMGGHTICMYVRRIDEEGNDCGILEFCLSIPIDRWCPIGNEPGGIADPYQDPSGYRLAETDIATEPLFKVYPNPVSDILHISHGEFPTSISLFDATGKLIRILKVEGQTLTQMDFGELQPGIYLLSIQNKDGVRTETVIKK